LNFTVAPVCGAALILGGVVQSWRQLTSRLCGFVAAGFLAAMMLLTVADVTLRAFFNTPLRGTYELIELLLAGTFFLALPAVFLRDEHIVVDVIDPIAPRAVPVLKRLAGVLAVVLLAAMAWQGWLAAQDTIAFGDVTADLALPRVLHWIALLVGVIGSTLAAAVMCLRADRRR
jgi:TRAP-type C4-dicarboxylate transport system permease small subunit